MKKKINHYTETDSLHTNSGALLASESAEMKDGIVIEFHANGNISEVDIQHTSQKLDLTSMETSAMPIQITKLPA